jgi:hypothetical protein
MLKIKLADFTIGMQGTRIAKEESEQTKFSPGWYRNQESQKSMNI